MPHAGTGVRPVNYTGISAHGPIALLGYGALAISLHTVTNHEDGLPKNGDTPSSQPMQPQASLRTRQPRMRAEVRV